MQNSSGPPPRYWKYLALGAAITPFAVTGALLIGANLFGFFLVGPMIVLVGFTFAVLKAWWIYAAEVAVPLTIGILPVAAFLLDRHGVRFKRLLLSVIGILGGAAIAAMIVLPPHWLEKAPPFGATLPWTTMTAALILAGAIAGGFAVRLFKLGAWLNAHNGREPTFTG